MNGPEHVREALRLADLAEQDRWDRATGSYKPSDDERQRMLLRAHLHASLARTAALTDSTTWSTDTGVETHRDRTTQDAWHEQFNVKN